MEEKFDVVVEFKDGSSKKFENCTSYGKFDDGDYYVQIDGWRTYINHDYALFIGRV